MAMLKVKVTTWYNGTKNTFRYVVDDVGCVLAIKKKYEDMKADGIIDSFYVQTEEVK